VKKRYKNIPRGNKEMPKRNPRDNPRRRKASEDMTDEGPPSSPDKNKRYNLRDRKKPVLLMSDDTEWVEDDTLEDSDDDEELCIEFHITGLSDESEADVDPFVQMLKNTFASGHPPAAKKRKREEDAAIELSQSEKKYFQSLDHAKRKELLSAMKRVSSLMLDEGDVPFKFKILQLPISDYMKTLVLKKIDALGDMSGDSGGAYKLKTWVDGFLRIPFGKTVPLPVKLNDGVSKCTDFMVNARSQMDSHIYGMKEAKTQIMQIISQWIVNPGSVGNVLALHGVAGVGKTSFARNGIASVLQRPFLFYTLGGASDISNFVGHSYTYEGSMCGRIVDGLMQCGVMNPVLYFDELDKVSATPHGEEIISMLIHLTDRSQNTEFHDRYFAGVDFDMSQCLFVFSFNDIEKVHPILRDRMNVIECGGYDEKDKLQILKNYVWPDILKRLSFTTSDIVFEEDAMKFIIDEYSNGEGGVRNLIRAVETAVTRLNMLRVSKHESMKDYSFYMDVNFPLKLTPQMVQTLLKDNNKKKRDETWRMMYM
jgi:ATP-dependent Lon protease